MVQTLVRNILSTWAFRDKTWTDRMRKNCHYKGRKRRSFEKEGLELKDKGKKKVIPGNDFTLLLKCIAHSSPVFLRLSGRQFQMALLASLTRILDVFIGAP